MGHHYVPQRYLRNFQSPSRSGFVYLFDKKTGQARGAKITKIAQERAFYSAETEKLLNELVETPAKSALAKLLNSEHPTKEERRTISLYMAVMLMRVPDRRHKALMLMPQVHADVFGEIRSYFLSLIGSQEVDQQLLHARLRQLDALDERYKQNPPAEVVERIRDPTPPSEVVRLIGQMAWRVCLSEGPCYFLTSDNPVFYFGAYGMKNRESEVVFPLSTTQALHCCWQRALHDTVFLRATQPIVREFNRRVASRTLRFAFYHEEADWVHRLLSKEDPFLCRVSW